MDIHGDYEWEMNKDHALTVSSGYNDDGSLKPLENGIPQTINITDDSPGALAVSPGLGWLLKLKEFVRVDNPSLK